MSGPFGSSPWGYNPSTGFYDYSIDQSLRLEQGGLEIVDSSNTGNNKTFTISMWFKRSELGVAQALFGAGTGSDATFAFYINSDDCLWYRSRYSNTNGGPFEWSRQTINAPLLIRDISTWYHLVVVTDTTRTGATSQLDYFDIYLNGVDITSQFTYARNTEKTASSTYNDPLRWNTASSRPQTVGFYGAQGTDTAFLDGYLAEVHSVDGQALDETYFGEFKNGIWVPKEVSIADYGTRGFYFDFADSSNLGNDASSGGTEDYTANGVASSDQSLDSPTNNWCTLNYNDSRTSQGWKEGGLNWLASSLTYKANSTMVIPEISDSDIYYAECRCNSVGYARGISPVTLSGANNNTSVTGMLMLYDNGRRWDGTQYLGSGNNEYATISAGDVFGIKAGNGELRFFQNGTDLGAAFTGLSGSYKFANFAAGATGTGQTWNFGQDSTFHGQETAGTTTDQNGFGLFKYSDASSCIALCAANIAEPTIGPNSTTQADDYFNTVLYTGDGSSSRAITGVNFAPDWVWLKTRNTTGSNFVYDTIRGATKGLHTNLEQAETTYTDGLLSFDSDGFTVGSRGNHNGSSDTMVSWFWKAGGTAVSNTDGSITSSVSANQNAGFSIVSWTGTGATGTIGHGLSSAPEMIIVKNREISSDFQVYHKDITDAPTHVMYLNQTNANADQARFNDTTPTNQVFSIGSGNSENKSNDGIIAYCFHSVEGYCKVGGFVGTGSPTFVHLGFRPAWIMVKNDNTSTHHWAIYDNKRNTFNVMDKYIYANTNGAENDADRVDFVSNGFVGRANNYDISQSGVKYIYLAFAEAPFKYANAR